MSVTIDAELRWAITQVMSNYAVGLDQRDWPLLGSCFCDVILIDYGKKSVSTGAPDVPRSADAWVDILKETVTRFDTTHHMINVYRVTPVVESDHPMVRCMAYLTAEHFLFNDPQMPIAKDYREYITVGGFYTNDFVQVDKGWRIVSSKLDVTWMRGDVALFDPETPRVVL
jgi:hypothetical protein